MFRHCRLFCLLALLALGPAGCDPGQSAARKMQGESAPMWPALEALTSGDESMSSVGMGMDRGGPAEARKAASSARFKELLDDFEKTPIPSSFATSERELAKKELVANLRKVAEDGPDSEVKAAYDKARENMKILASP